MGPAWMGAALIITGAGSTGLASLGAASISSAFVISGKSRPSSAQLTVGIKVAWNKIQHEALAIF